MERPLVLYDSGLGGVSLLLSLMQDAPPFPLIYFADTAYFPYGSRPQFAIAQRAEQCLRYLAHFRPQKILLACQTLSTALVHREDWKERYAMEGMVDRTLAAIRSGAPGKRIGFLATPATISSGIYQKLLLENGFSMIDLPSASLASLVERGNWEGPALREAIHEALLPLKNSRVDALLLGCTHYSFVVKTITEIYSELPCLDPSSRSSQKSGLLRDPSLAFYVTGSRTLFTSHVKKLYPFPCEVISVSEKELQSVNMSHQIESLDSDEPLFL